MRIGLHSCKYNFGDNTPISSLLHCIRDKKHDLIFLDTDLAQRDGSDIIFPTLPPKSEPLDMFISYPAEGSPWETTENRNVSFFEQLEWLSSRFPSPTPYFAQRITNSKTLMAEVFAAAKIPILPSVDGSILQNKKEILHKMETDGHPLVFKEDFGGSGQGMIRAETHEDAIAAFNSFEQTGRPFLVQPYINLKTADNRSIDYRAIVVGDKVLGGIKRTTQPDEWRTNNYLGSQNTPHTFTPKQEADAIKALKVAQLGFGSVDIAIDPHTGQHFLFEINDGMDMGHLSKVKPEIDLPGTIIQMCERIYGEQPTHTPCQQAFSSAGDPHTPSEKKPQTSSPQIIMPKNF